MIAPNHAPMASGPGAPYGGMPGGAPPGFGPPGPSAPRTDALAIIALVFGVIGLVVGGANIFVMVFGACCPLCTVGATMIGVIALVPSVLGLTCGALSLKRVKERPEELTGKGLAIAGTVVSGVAVLVALATMLLPWLGLGCLAATAPHPPPGAPPPTPDPWGVPVPDPSALPFDPNAAPVDPSALPVDPGALPPTGGPP